MIRFNRKTIYYGIATVLFITYLLYLQSDASSENVKSETIVDPNAGNPAAANPAAANPIVANSVAVAGNQDSLELSVDYEKFKNTMSDVRGLITKSSNPKIFDYIKFEYKVYQFNEFGEMADQFRMLQKFWIVNRKLTEAVKSNDKILHAQVKNFLLYKSDQIDELKEYTNDLHDFYYLMLKLEQKLTGWVNPYYADLSSLYDTFTPDSKAIVIPISNEHMSSAATVIKATRDIHNVEIPIHIYYIGDKDLSGGNRVNLKELGKNVYTHDITKYLDDRIIGLEGWALKPFAALLAPAQHVMLIDADVNFIQSPELLFERPDYEEKKSLFFLDSVISKNKEENAKWALSFIMNDGDYSELYPNQQDTAQGGESKKLGDYIVPKRLEDSSYFTLKSEDQQESGVVLIDKLERFIPLIATCGMNNKYERDTVTYKNIHGGKETFWMGYEMVGGQYAWNSKPPGVISDANIKSDINNYKLEFKSESDSVWKKAKKLCSAQILHFDDKNKPYWFNGGLYANKNYKKLKLGKFSHYLQGVEATWETSEHNWVCLTSKTATVKELDESDSEKIEKTKNFFTELKKDL